MKLTNSENFIKENTVTPSTKIIRKEGRTEWISIRSYWNLVLGRRQKPILLQHTAKLQIRKQVLLSFN